MKKIRQSNTLTRGELSALETSAPMTKAYYQGCEEVRGFDLSEKGATPMRVPVASDESRGFAYRAHFYKGVYYLRNTSTAISQDNAALPVEAATLYKSLDAKVREMTMAGQLRAAPADVAAPDYVEFRDSGKYDTDRGNTFGKLAVAANAASTRTFIVTRPTKIYRAFFPGLALGTGAGAFAGWGVHGSRRHKEKGYGELGGVVVDVGFDNTTSEVGILRGGGSGNVFRQAANILRNDHVELSQSLEIYSITLAPGVYEFSQDLFLVGTARMFKTAPQDRTYETSATYWNASRSLRIIEDRTWCDEEGALVMAWGQITDPTTDHSGAWTPPTFTKLATVGQLSFWFSSRTTIAGSRRFGPCSIESDGESFGATKIGLMGGSSDDGRLMPASTVAADDPYTMKIAGGVVWFEEIQEGFLIGTPSGEYILANPQVNPVTGGASLQRISAVGSPGHMDDVFRQSANLAGDVFYISKRGITTLDFSNEGQVYLPRDFKFAGRRIAGQTCTSIAAAVEEQCLYLSFSDGSLWKLWPATAGLAEVPLQLSAGYKLQGLTTRDGEPFLVILKPDGNRYFCPVAQARAPESYLRTTAFGRDIASRAQVKKLMVTGTGLRTGEFRVEGGAWKGLALNAGELASGMSGTKEILVLSDRPGAAGRGKTVEFRFQAAVDLLEDPGVVSAIGVEMEV